MGAEVLADGRVHFRVWAPQRQKVAVAVRIAADNNGDVTFDQVELGREADGWFSGFAETAQPGSWYGYQLDDDPRFYPDPASRFQPEGPHGLSQVVDSAASFPWSDADWPGVRLPGQVIYELHIGTFTTEGTWAAASREIGRAHV